MDNWTNEQNTASTSGEKRAYERWMEADANGTLNQNTSDNNGFQTYEQGTNNGYQSYSQESNNGYTQYNGGDGYSSWDATQPRQTQMNSNYGLEEPVSMGEWIISLAIAYLVPCAGIVMMFVWAFSADEKKSKSNFFKAQLIFMGIGMILSIFFYAFAIAFAMRF